jgi:hypothetical protein
VPRKPPVERVARLVWFVDGDPQFERQMPGPNRVAAEAVVVKLQAEGALVAGDEALTTAFVMLAEAVDASPTDARLWGQYRDAVAGLRTVAKEKAPTDDDDWTSALGAAPVRDAPQPKPRKPRAAGGRGVAKAGKAADAVPAARVGRRARGGT